MYMYYHLFLSPIASEVHHVTQYSSIIIIVLLCNNYCVIIIV